MRTLFIVSLALSFGPGCKKDEPPKAPTAAPVTPAAPAPKPASPTSGGVFGKAQPASGVAPVAAPPGEGAPPPEAAPAGCRALVQLATPSGFVAEDGQDPSLVPREAYTVLDIRLGAQNVVKQAPGLVVRSDSQTFALQIQRSEVRGSSGKFQTTDLWDRLVAIDLGSGTSAVWLEARPQASNAAGDLADVDVGTTELTAERLIDVSGIVGPYVGVFLWDTGFAGGVHGYDDTVLATLSAPTGAKVDVAALLGEPLMQSAAREAANLAARRARTGDEGFEASSVKASAFRGIALGVDSLAWPSGLMGEGEEADRKSWAIGLHAHTRVECCSWAENHGYMDISIPVPIPGRLAQLASAPTPGPERLVSAPNGCGAVGLNGGLVLIRAGSEGAASTHQPTGAAPVAILGVTWLDPNDPLDVTKLPAPLIVRPQE